MSCSHDLDFLIQELQCFQNKLETLDSLEEILAIYEKMFSLIHEGMSRISAKNQQCYILSVQPNGELVKDTSGVATLQTFATISKQ
ncbi:hypothetical protein [Chlamydia vaughanii]|uniref:hypothetical protein n=1 Tax=Chlamydia vaughanii TaxID=3112552 RepID=UPI0032B24B07